MQTTPFVTQTIESMRASLASARGEGKTIGLVPTMGALHAGHLALVDEAVRRTDYVAATIFVNPRQFGEGEDLDRYPRDLEGDVEKLRRRGVDHVFAPDVSVMYPPGFKTSVRVSTLTTTLCGISRPHHFDGVTTVVTKLFNIAGPCTAVFGKKDYQQLQVIKRLTRDLDIPVTVVGVPTVREGDGLAMSSRNGSLNPDQRKRARRISSGLGAAHALWNDSERATQTLRKAVEHHVARAADSVVYVTAACPDTLETIPDDATAPERLLIAVAARFGDTRLIDNTVLGEDSPPVVPK